MCLCILNSCLIIKNAYSFLVFIRLRDEFVTSEICIVNFWFCVFYTRCARAQHKRYIAPFNLLWQWFITQQPRCFVQRMIFHVLCFVRWYVTSFVIRCVA